MYPIKRYSRKSFIERKPEINLIRNVDSDEEGITGDYDWNAI
ncbi:MAG TPA: hypothetical protein VIK72_16010 [Clostridiaceae bacterium]